MKKILFIIGFALLLSATASATQATLLSVHGTVKYNGVPVSSGTLRIEVWDALSLGNRIYYEDTTILSGGKFDVTLGTGNGAPTTLLLNYNKTYFLWLIKDPLGTPINLFPARRPFVGGQGQIHPSSIRNETGTLPWPSLADVLNIGADASSFTATTRLGGNLQLDQNLNVTGAINNYKEQGFYVNNQLVRNNLKILFGSASVSAGTNSEVTVSFLPVSFDVGPFTVVATPWVKVGGTYTNLVPFYIIKGSGSSFKIKQIGTASADTIYTYIVIGYEASIPPCGQPPLDPCT